MVSKEVSLEISLSEMACENSCIEKSVFIRAHNAVIVVSLHYSGIVASIQESIRSSSDHELQFK
jgi:hypothetical protein